MMQTNWLLLVAIVVVAVAIGAVWRSKHSRAMGKEDPVYGILQVIRCTSPGPEGVYSKFLLKGVVSAPGLVPTPVERHGLGWVEKWPVPGQQLPVRVVRADPSRFDILWEQVGVGRPTPAGPAHGLTAQLPGGGWEPATAVVAGWWETPAPPGSMPLGGAVALTLEVTRANGACYPARTSAVCPTLWHRHQLTVVGARLPVRVDPVDPTRVAVDHTALGPAT